ncbi:replication protein A 70 kDa DNA-binding subunit B [Tanacetum coccineum]|uniref:Replication protein A 70 kDa DNA-binding subunit B n=1 Tax=Tanacetum coccineum TaxID=301880 RepID=A0ABQ5A9H7_9ASTR
MNVAHDPYSLDLVLQDAHNTRIHVYIKKEFMFRFEPLFEVGQCYILSNFGIAENSGRLPLLPHRYKISFYKCTIVHRIEPFDNNTNGFILEPFNHLLDPEHHQYYENDDVDVIGSVVGIGDIVPVMSAAGKKIRRTIIVEDVDGSRLDLTFWDTWASIWDQYATKHDEIEHLVIILQLGKEYLPFTMPYLVLRFLLIETSQKLQLSKKANQVKIELFTPEVKAVSIAEFFHGAINRMVYDSHCIVYARIHKIYKEHEHGTVQPASRFKVIVRVIDKSGKKYLFKLFYLEYNVAKNNHTYYCDSFSEDVELINHFKNDFKDTETYDEESSDDLAQSITKENNATNEDSTDEHDLDMHTTSKTRYSTTSVEGSSSKKRKLIIDLDEVESEPEEGNISKGHELVAVKIEPED